MSSCEAEVTALRDLCVGSWVAAQRLGVTESIKTNLATAAGFYLERCGGDATRARHVAEKMGDPWAQQVADYLKNIEEAERR
jgi:hypothetical protein